MATEVSVRDIATGVPVFYLTYAAARAAANSGDVISIYKNLNEQIELKNGVDVYIDPGTIINYSGSGPTITDNNVACTCYISGAGIVRNSYSGTTKQECIKISNAGSIVEIECFQIEGAGEISSGIEGATINVFAAKKVRIVANTISNTYNTALRIASCYDIYINVRNIISGKQNNPNTGAPVISINGNGSIYINELRCVGYGSCFEHNDGVIGASINKLFTFLPNNETPPPSLPTLFLGNGTGKQDLVLYFDEIRNFNSNDGVAVQISEGKASLIGRSIYATQGKSVDLIDEIESAYFQCDEIISLTHGINIENSDEQIIIDANYIEGSDGNDGVIKCNDNCNVYIKNAKIKNTTESTSYGIYITNSGQNQFIEIENLIIITSTEVGDFSIFRFGSGNNLDIKNLLLFAKQDVSPNITFIIGNAGNYKLIIDPLII